MRTKLNYARQARMSVITELEYIWSLNFLVASPPFQPRVFPSIISRISAGRSNFARKRTEPLSSSSLTLITFRVPETRFERDRVGERGRGEGGGGGGERQSGPRNYWPQFTPFLQRRDEFTIHNIILQRVAKKRRRCRRRLLSTSISAYTVIPANDWE